MDAPESRPGSGRPPRLGWRGVLLVVAAVALVFAPALGLYFHADDFDWLWAAAAAARVPGRLLPEDVNGHFRPLAELLWAVEYRLFGLDALGYHVVALALHGVAALAVGALACDLTASRRGGLAAAMLFAIGSSARTPPLWPSAAPDLLLGALAASALVALRRGGEWLAPGLAAFAAALLAKETAVVLLPVALLVVPAVRRRRTLGITLGLITLAAAVPHLASAALSPYVGARFALGVHVVGNMLALLSALLLPFFSGEGGLAGGGSLFAEHSGLRIALGLGALAVVSALAVRRIGRKTVVAWMAALVFVLLAPALSVSRLEPRWLYLAWVLTAPLLAAALLTVASALEALRGRRAGSLALALLVLAHLVAHGALLRKKIERDRGRDVWIRTMVEAAGKGHPALADGDVVEVIVPFGAELRSWPIGIALAVGHQVRVRPIDDRTSPTPGVAVLDGSARPPRWLPRAR